MHEKAIITFILKKICMSVWSLNMSPALVSTCTLNVELANPRILQAVNYVLQFTGQRNKTAQKLSEEIKSSFSALKPRIRGTLCPDDPWRQNMLHNIDKGTKILVNLQVSSRRKFFPQSDHFNKVLRLMCLLRWSIFELSVLISENGSFIFFQQCAASIPLKNKIN